jgi:hypothetical protein
MSYETIGTPEVKVRTIERAGSVAGLFPALRRGAKAAVYEAPPINASLHLEKLGSVQRRSLMSNIAYNVARMFEPMVAGLDQPSAVQYHREELRKSLATAGHDSMYIAIGLAFYDAVAADMQRIVDSVAGAYVRSAIPMIGRTGKSTESWHLDRKNDDTDLTRVRLVRVYRGPSTEYACDVRGTGKKRFGDGAVAMHRVGKDGAWHRSPASAPEDRLAFVLTLAVPAATLARG